MLARIRHLAHLLAYSWRALGARKIARNLVAWLRDRDARDHGDEFDARFGTDTATSMTPAEAGIPGSRRGDAVMYLPTAERDLAAMLESLGWDDALLAETTFVDVGSGKGRVVLLAAMRRFREVVGVELSARLHAIALRNFIECGVRRALASPVRLEHADATELAIPTGPLVAYMFHPFGETVAEAVVDRIVAAMRAQPRPAAIIYAQPILQEPLPDRVFERGGVFARAVDGGRATRHFEVRWTVWTNDTWLADRYRRVAA